MGDPIYIDTQGIESSVYNALVESLPDLNPLIRAAYVFELQEVEKRLDALGKLDAIRTPGEESKASKEAMEALWQRRNELLGLLWPSLPSPGES
jgi:hypothetical protein